MSLRRSIWIVPAASMFFSAIPAVAQSGPFEQTYKATKTQVESALRDAHAYGGGKLPLLDGFVISNGESLDDYQRPFYQYSIKLTSINASETRVTVSAKISAWHASSSPNEAGYKAFTSSGRLETDLLDRVQNSLAAKGVRAESTESSTPRSTAPRPFDEALRESRNAPTGSQPASIDTDARIQRLTKEQIALEEILRSQSHPTDLVAVKVAHTPVFTKPQEGSRILFFADLHDEFQVLDSDVHWYHVKISGISRGWIRKTQVEVPSNSEKQLGKAMEQNPAPSIREEVAQFPGSWPTLRGKNVKVVWVKPSSSNGSSAERLSQAESILRKAGVENAVTAIEGVVIVFDSAEGGMMAATLPSLRGWRSGALSEQAFLQQCWFDPIEAFVNQKLN